VLLKTGGYGNPPVIRDLCAAVDAVNVDFKAWDPEVYRTITTCERDTMMQSIQIATEADVWLEVTNLVVPGYNDDERQVTAMAQWIIDNCGRDTPLHMSRFFPKYRFRSIDPTSRDTLLKLRKVAFNTGLRYVYLGNMGGDPSESTYCPKCWLKVIERVGFRVTNKGLDVKTGKCTKCGLRIPGVWV
jgi:pyruvate formate lyase activating enzyme